MSSIDEYLAGLAPPQRDALTAVCLAVREVAPEADEGRSYGVPAFLVGGRPLLGLQAAKAHLSLFPFSPAAIDAVRDRLDGFDLAKGTIRFTPEQPVPRDVVADLVRARLRELAAR
jgi:uncharacterized protein YdhG (YjbR/CyaY superfamily)